MAVESTQIYWATTGDGAIHVAPLGAGAATTLFDLPLAAGPINLAIGP